VFFSVVSVGCSGMSGVDALDIFFFV